ncbi:MAG: winged helix-turn-helix transcriptional regulator, partial [Candidatus Jordarchaeales archaeon]
MRDGEVDEIDRKILSILLDDGRKSFNEISLMVGVSTGTVANRVRKLIERGVIKRFTVELDWRKLGFDVFA